MNQSDSDNYLFLCRELFLEEITPSGKYYSNQKYIQITSIAKKYFDRGEYEEFANFFQEGQYYVQLWTAHLILEYGSPSPNLIKRCIEMIKRYSSNPLAPNISAEELNWLNDNKKNYEQYLID